MDSKQFFKITSFLFISFIVYIIFFIFFLSPKINDYLTNRSLEISKEQFEKLANIINNESKKFDDKDEFLEDIKLLVNSLTFGKTGYVFIFDEHGKIIFDPSGEFAVNSFKELKLPGANERYLYKELKEYALKNKPLEYFWNKIEDPYNYKYKKIYWVSYNERFAFYIASNLYKDDFTNYTNNSDHTILYIFILLFIILTSIGIFTAIKIIAPFNKALSELNKIDIIKSSENSIKNKDKVVYFSKQFNNLIDEVELNRKTLEIQEKLFKNRLYIDSLTGIKNRTALEDEIKDKEFVSIVLIDIESFSDINELYGFHTGDLVLKEIANILIDFSEKYEVSPYRLYGNVFALVNFSMMNFTKFDYFISESLKLFKEKSIFVEKENLELYVSVTLGISIAQEDPIKTSIIALNKAKKTNNLLFVYNTEIDTQETIKNSIYWREKIKEAILNKNVVPFFQAIYNRELDVIKYEALIRIKDFDENGKEIFYLPYLFLDTAFKTKQYLALASLMFSKIVSILPNTDKMISFNISFDDILNYEFMEMIDKNLDTLDIENRSKLVFEVLETDSISEYEILEDFVNRYRKQGIQIAIDDFGSGYSNFAHILKIKPDYIKIDGSLIKNITDDKNALEMVKSIIDFSKALNIKLVAEFVHSKEVLEKLIDLDVDEFQGFYLGIPEPKIE